VLTRVNDVVNYAITRFTSCDGERRFLSTACPNFNFLGELDRKLFLHQP
jgi:hypothetical protein